MILQSINRVIEKRFWSFQLLLSSAFFILYALTISHNYSIAHDSVEYLLKLREGHVELHPNHLLYLPLLDLASTFFGLFSVSQAMAVGLTGSVAGALSILAGWKILVQRLHVSPVNAFIAMLAAGFTYGTWYYSVAVEIYIYPLMLLLWASYLLMGEQLRPWQIVLAAALQSAAILIHQTAVLFSLLPFFSLVLFPNVPIRQRLLNISLYVAVGVVLVAGGYCLAANTLGKTESVEQFVSWFLGYGSQDQYWSPASPKALALAAVGFVRAIVSIYYVFAFPDMQNFMGGLFQGKSLEDEMFLVRNVSSVGVIVLVLTTIFMAIASVVVLLMLLVGRSTWRDVLKDKAIWLLLLWLIPYVLFFIAWDATNVDFWVMQVFVVLLLVGVFIDRFPSGVLKKVQPVLLLAVSLFCINGLGTILPAANKQNDYYQQYVRFVESIVDENALVVLGDAWPVATHFRYHSMVDIVSVSQWYREKKTPQDMLVLMQEKSAGKSLYFSADVLHPGQATLSYYGKSYQSVLNELLSLTNCELKKIQGVDLHTLYFAVCSFK